MNQLLDLRLKGREFTVKQQNLLLLKTTNVCHAFDDFKAHLRQHKPELLPTIVSAPDDPHLLREFLMSVGAPAGYRR